MDNILISSIQFQEQRQRMRHCDILGNEVLEFLLLSQEDSESHSGKFSLRERKCTFALSQTSFFRLFSCDRRHFFGHSMSCEHMSAFIHHFPIRFSAPMLLNVIRETNHRMRRRSDQNETDDDVVCHRSDGDYKKVRKMALIQLVSPWTLRCFVTLFISQMYEFQLHLIPQCELSSSSFSSWLWLMANWCPEAQMVRDCSAILTRK